MSASPRSELFLAAPARTLVCLAACSLFAGCSSISNVLSSDKVDYKSGSAARSSTLEVPPDLTQLTRESRYQQAPTGAPVSAAAMQQQAAKQTASPTAAAIAPQSAGAMRIEREGSQRWLVTPLTPEQLWPVLKNFWQDQGFGLALEDANAGVIETEWSENRAKLPNDAIRNTVGRLLDVLYDTGERDRFRTRLERGPNGTEVYISHRGLAEVYVNQRDNQTTWQTRPSDPSLEAEMLTRLMTRLGATAEQAKAVVAAPVAAPARARFAEGRGAGLVIDDGFDTAWRRVGLALDRTGFTVEDRDRGQGVYFVRYADPAKERKSEPGFLSKLFSFGGKNEVPLSRYRIVVKPAGPGSSSVSVLDEQGNADGSETARRIATLLVDDLK